MWVNVSLNSGAPLKNSVVCGYATDETTDNPIENADVLLVMVDDQGHEDWNYSRTDSFGYYSMNIAAGMLVLYIYADGYYSECAGYYDIIEYETLQIDIALYPKSPENSVVHGYVTDEETGDPIEGAYVNLDWQDDQGHYYGNYTYTDSSGYYRMNVAAGRIDLYARADGYYSEHTDNYDIGEYETLQIDIALYPKPPENSVVHGYVTDEETGDPIEDAYVNLDWQDDQGHYDCNYTYTDSSGYYRMNVAAGRIDLYASADGYYSEYTDNYDIGEYETLWINMSMERELTEVEIIKPQKALYMNNNKLLRLFITTIVIGDIDIEVYASDGVSHVEFYMDGKLQKTDYNWPYVWTWDERSFLRHRHKLKVIAYDKFGGTASDKLVVWKFL